MADWFLHIASIPVNFGRACWKKLTPSKSMIILFDIVKISDTTMVAQVVALVANWDETNDATSRLV